MSDQGSPVGSCYSGQPTRREVVAAAAVVPMAMGMSSSERPRPKSQAGEARPPPSR